jgi:hypothetical protein
MDYPSRDTFHGIHLIRLRTPGTVEEVREQRAKVYILTDVANFADHVVMSKTDGLTTHRDDFDDEEIATSAVYVNFTFDQMGWSHIADPPRRWVVHPANELSK